MFGFSFADRVKKIIRQDFGYEPRGGTLHAMGSICDQAKSSGANEHSAAIMTMLVAMNSLGVDPDDERVEMFLKENSLNILRQMHLANQPEADIKQLVAEVLAKHGLVNSDDLDSTDVYEDDSGDKLIDKLLDVGNLFIRSLLLHDKMFADNARKILSARQMQLLYFMQLWGAIDFVMQSEGSADTIKFMVAMSLLPDGGDGKALFQWDADQVRQAIAQVEEAQVTDWGMQVIVSGGRSLQQILRGEDGGASLDDVLNDVGVLVALKDFAPD